MRSPLRDRLHDIIVTHDDLPARVFDVVLILAILASVSVVVLDSVPSIAVRHGPGLRAAEWFFTVLFTVEYLLRLWTERHPWRYARSFYGLVDLLSFLPTYLAVAVPGARFFVAFRVLRVLRIFRILKLAHYVLEGAVLGAALRASRYKITVFVSTVLTVVVVVGALMYLIEGPASGFTSIPVSMYWAIVTLTTVGYGDIAPATAAGQLLASALMILGYGIIAVPTGIVTLELDRASRQQAPGRPCPGCGVDRHDPDARYCRYCGSPL